jgi:phospholipid transport system transporter-binding protein
MLLPDTVTLAQAASLLPRLDAEVDGAAAGGSGRFVMDASALAAFDTSAIALVLQARRLAEARGLVFELRALPAQLRQLAELYGVAELLSASPATAPSAAPSSNGVRSAAT